MKNAIQPANVVTVVAPYAVLSGDGVMVGSLFGVAATKQAINESLEIAVEGGYEVKKLSTDVVTQGAKLNWNNTTKQLQLAAGDLAGVATALVAAGNGVTKVLVKLTPV